MNFKLEDLLDKMTKDFIKSEVFKGRTDTFLEGCLHALKDAIAAKDIKDGMLSLAMYDFAWQEAVIQNKPSMMPITNLVGVIGQVSSDDVASFISDVFFVQSVVNKM